MIEDVEKGGLIFVEKSSLAKFWLRFAYSIHTGGFPKTLKQENIVRIGAADWTSAQIDKAVGA